MDFVNEITDIENKISRLEYEKKEIIEKNVRPIVDKIIEKLNDLREKRNYDFAIKQISFNDVDGCYTISLGFPNGLSFKKRLDYKHRISKIAYEDIDDYYLKYIYIIGAIA